MIDCDTSNYIMPKDNKLLFIFNWKVLPMGFFNLIENGFTSLSRTSKITFLVYGCCLCCSLVKLPLPVLHFLSINNIFLTS